MIENSQFNSRNVVPREDYAPKRRTPWKNEIGRIHDERAKRCNALSAAIAAGKNPRREIYQFLRDRDVRRSAVLKALGKDATESQMYAVLREVHVGRENVPTVRWHRARKASGGFRVICSGMPKDLLALHYMLKWALAASLPLADFIYVVSKKGKDTAIKEAVAAVRDGHDHLAAMDITDCFQRTNPDSFYNLPLTREVISRAIDTRNLLFREFRGPSGPCIPDSEEPNDCGPRGLMQGSPLSNIILAWLLSDIPTIDGVRLFICSDNILVAARSQDGREAMICALVQHFAGCAYGPHALHDIRRVSPGDEPLPFLSYLIDPSGTDAQVSDDALTDLSRTLGILGELNDVGAREYFMASATKIRGFMTGFAAAPDRKRQLEPHVEMARQELVGRGRYELAYLFDALLDGDGTDAGWAVSSILNREFDVKKHRKLMRLVKSQWDAGGF